MSTDTAPPTPQDRERAEELLQKEAVAFMGLVERSPDGDTAGMPYVVPVNFAFCGSFASDEVRTAGGTVGAALGDETDRSPDAETDRPLARLLFQTGIGRKTRALVENPYVCLAVTADVSFSAGPKPCEDGFDYRSVLIWGKAKLLESREDRAAGLRKIVAKYDPQAVDRAFDEQDFEQTQVYEVTIDTLSYKEQPRHRSG
jgi:hypothetical protein